MGMMRLLGFLAFGTTVLASSGWAVDLVDMPVKGVPEKPLIILDLGKAPAAPGKEQATVVYGGELISCEGAESASTAKDEVATVKSGFGTWAAVFRFALAKDHPSGDFLFWARWKQGGDPNACEQTFELWAGSDEASLELRATQALKPDGWQYAWRDGKTLTLKAEDAVIEVRTRGNGHDGKIYDAFVLSGPKPPPELPEQGTVDTPVVFLGFGTDPLRKVGEDPAVQVFLGQVTAGEGTEKASLEPGTAMLAHAGFGTWSGTFSFGLDRPVKPGFYGFHAYYRSGGEVSQVRQTFTVKAGPSAETLGVRGVFQTVNSTPWQNQWVKGDGSFILFPGDTVIQIVNEGKADGAKIFSGFAMNLATPIPAWMNAARCRLRSQVLAFGKSTGKSNRRLYVVDGDSASDEVIFKGLARDEARPAYEKMELKYLLGAEAEAMANWLNLPGCPAAVVVEVGTRKVKGVLCNPASEAAVVQFLVEPGQGGMIPAYPDLKLPEPVALVGGAPTQWLIATGWPGRCGVGLWGVDAELKQRPNPGDPYAYGYFTAGNRSTRWEPRPVGANGVCRIAELTESYAWGKGTSYAVAYLWVETPGQAVLHVQHTGIQSAVFLNGVEQPLTTDANPPFALSRQAPKTEAVVAVRAGQEIHDDVTVPQSAQPPLAAMLTLAKGWHCLVLKLVHAQNAGESVLFTGHLTDDAGTPLAGIRTGISDPTAALGMARAAACFWPSLTLAGIPGTLPRPGEPLTLVADMRVVESFFSSMTHYAFLPFEATLRIRMEDYDGNEIGVFETRGTFPDTVRMDLGKAPGPGYYSLTAELVAADGRLIRRFHPDGFSVVLGNAAQKERVDKKKLWNSWYYALNEDWSRFASWLERIGMFKNQGSFPGVPEGSEAKWQDAQTRGIVLVGDFAGDSSWMNNSAAEAQKIVDVLPKYTRYFKSVNEIDGRCEAEWVPVREPAQWVQRAQWQYEAIHQARPDAVCFGGSLYCSGQDRQFPPPILSPRTWFRECLKLGLDKYIDVWDVHAYPQFPPVLEAPSVSNSNNETDLGVLDVFKELGMKNTKPFILGETSALVWHGFTGMRWQAETVAKMAAWVNSREDWLGIAFCAAHHNRRITAEDYAMAHNPGEAAIYTASALIDGFPFRRQATDDKEIQAAYFGETFMIWRTDERRAPYSLPLAGEGPWVLVDVVGKPRPLEVKDGVALLEVGSSPCYVLPRASYEQLTR
jgi:hypothetical protein